MSEQITLEEEETEETERQKLIQEVEHYVEQLTEGFCHEHRINSSYAVSAAVLDFLQEERVVPVENEEFQVVKGIVRNWLNRKLIAKNRETIS